MISLFAKQIEVDEDGKATNIKLHSIRRQHMRAFHLSWLSFLVAFTGWFAVPPLVPTLKKDLGLTDAAVASANVTSVSATIAARLAVGPLCDRYGPRRVMAGLLILGAIATGLIGFISDGTGLIAIRFFIGILGATFVPCQFWTTKMFSSNIVGTANALAGGWGNMGGGLTYLIMPLLYNGFALVLPLHAAWRVTFVVPAVICIIVGLLDYFCADDYPGGDWLKMRASKLSRQNDVDVNEKVDGLVDEKGKVEPRTPSLVQEQEPVGPLSTLSVFLIVLSDPTVAIIMLQYACSFGLELAVDNIIGSLFTVRFGLDQTTAALFGSVFGLMNIFSRASGGFFADWLNSVVGRGVLGRILAQQIFTFCEGIALISFSYATGSLASTVAVMVLFSYFVQGSCGTTFSVAPFVNPAHYGVLTGLVGAGGNLGGLIFNYVFKAYGSNFEGAFRTIGITVLCVSILSMVMRVEGKMLWMIFKKN